MPRLNGTLLAVPAVGLRLTGRPNPRVVVLVGDAELEEGSNVEAIQFAGRVGLDRLTTVVIDKDSAGRGWPGGIAARFAIEGWATVDVDGRNHDALRRAFTVDHSDRRWPSSPTSSPKPADR